MHRRIGAADLVRDRADRGLELAGGIVDDRIEIFEHGDPDFAEYAVLVEAMPGLLRCAYIEQRDLFAGRWAPVVRQVLDQPPPTARPATDGAQVVARGLAEYLSSRGDIRQEAGDRRSRKAAPSSD